MIDYEVSAARRMRAALRCDEAVVAAITRGWQSLPKDSNGYLRQPSYTRLHVKVSQALLGLCESEAEQYAKEDWQEDAVMGGRHSPLPTLLCRGLSQRSHDTCHILQTGHNL